jgi:hypothetical protein
VNSLITTNGGVPMPGHMSYGLNLAYEERVCPKLYSRISHAIFFSEKENSIECQQKEQSDVGDDFDNRAFETFIDSIRQDP